MVTTPSEIQPIFEQDIRRASAFKEKGNNLFRQRDLLAAHKIYTKALKVVPAPLGILDNLPRLEVSILRITLLSNRSLVCFQLGWLMGCINDCSYGIDQSCTAITKRDCQRSDAIITLHNKMLARRASAWDALGFESRARRDYEAVILRTSGKKHCPIMKCAEAALQNLFTRSADAMVAFWDDLPSEHRTRILSFLPLGSFGRSAIVSREWLEVSRQNVVWCEQPRTVLGPLAGGAIALEAGFQVEGEHGAMRSSSWSVQNQCGEEKHYFLELQESEEADVSESKGCGLLFAWVPKHLKGMFHKPPIILDIGMCYTKAGLAGTMSPVLVPNILLCGHASVVDEGLLTDNQQLLETLLIQIFQILNVDPQGYSVVLCLSSYQRSSTLHSQYESRSRLVERFLIERFSVISVCSVESSVLALLSHGAHTGVVVDIGLGSTRVTPVIRGTVCRTSICTEYVGAANCTNYLLQKINEKNVSFRDPDMSGLCFMLRVKNVKEDFGFVANSHTESMQNSPREIKVLSEVLDEPLYLASELATIGEMFFNPQCTGPQHSYYGASKPPPTLGIHHLIHQAVINCQAETPTCRELLANIVLAGGTANFPGMGSRLQSEVTSICNAKIDCEPRVLLFRPEPAWVGGSVLGTAKCSFWQDHKRMRSADVDSVSTRQ